MNVPTDKQYTKYRVVMRRLQRRIGFEEAIKPSNFRKLAGPAEASLMTDNEYRNNNTCSAWLVTKHRSY